MLSGEPGIGKSALITELLAQGRRRGYRTLSGRAVEVERDIAFGLFADALAEEIDAGGERRVRLEADQKALLATVLPSAGSRAPRAPQKFELDERDRLLGAMQALLAGLGAGAPLVLGLDDLHWADPASIDLLCRLLHRGIGAPSLLLLASRPAQSEPRLLEAFEEAERHGEARVIEPAPLSERDAQRLLGEGIEEALGERIYRQSGGNPFYLEQLAGAARRGAALPEGEEGLVEGKVPAAVGAAIRGELGRLAPGARDLLAGAALLGEPFELALAAETADIDPKELGGSLEELLSADLIRRAGAPQRFGFRHPIVRQAVYESAGAGWRLAAHARAAKALESRGAPAAARAPHIERSARFGEEAVAAALAEAGQETAVRAPASAAHWFEAALALIPQREDNLELCLGLVLQRAMALGTAGKIEESRAALGEFLAVAPPQAAPLRHQASVIAAMLDGLLGRQALGRGLLEEELAKLGDQDGPEGADLKRELAFTYFFDAEWEAMADWARRSLASECEGLTRVGALAGLALAEFGLGEFDSIGGPLAEAGELFEGLAEAEVTPSQPAMAIWLGWAEVCGERFEQAVSHTERAIAIARSLGQRDLTVGLAVVQSQALALRGEGAALEVVADQAMEAALMSSSELFLSWAMTLRCQAAILGGELHAAVRFGERNLGVGALNSPQAGSARVLLAWALLEIGEPQRCRELLLSAQGRPDLPAFRLYEALTYELLARAELALGHLDRAEELVAEAERSPLEAGMAVGRAQVQRARALVLLARDRPREALIAAAASRRAAERVGARVEAARSQMLEGVALAASADRKDAIEALRAAHKTLLDSGARRYADQSGRELRRLGQAVGVGADRGASASERFGLTGRESEVIELVAEGRTNRQIAAALFLSVRTVDRHVSRIFQKLGVNSRAAATSAFERARAAPDGAPGDRAEADRPD